MSGGHFIEKCECGRTLSQCRCPDPNKVVRTKSPCQCKPDRPPKGYDSWLDWVLEEGCGRRCIGSASAARTELAELRKLLNDRLKQDE